VGRYNDQLTGQQVKAKEAQALVKAFEASLAAYFAQLTSVEGLGLQSHSLIRAFAGESGVRSVLRPVLSAALGTVSSKEEVVRTVRERLEMLRGQPIGWLSPLVPSVAIAAEVDGGQQEGAIDTNAAESVSASDASAGQQSGVKLDAAMLEKLAQNADKVSDEQSLVFVFHVANSRRCADAADLPLPIQHYYACIVPSSNPSNAR
jgi:hypothetical protein